MKTSNSFFRWSFLIAYLLLCFEGVVAREANLVVVATVVSGSLKPLRLEIDGKQLIKDVVTVSELKINSKPVIPLQQKGSPFFLQVNESPIEVTISNPEQRHLFHLPSASIIEKTETEVILKVEGNGLKARINKKPVPIESNLIRWKYPQGPEYSLWVLDLTDSSTGLRRTYNLEFPKIPKITEQKTTAETQGSSTPSLENGFESRLSLGHFSLAPILAIQSSSHHSESFNFGWTPRYEFLSHWTLSLLFAGNFFKSYSTKSNFLFLEAGAYLDWTNQQFGLRAGPLLQFWNTQGGLVTAASLGPFLKTHFSIWGISFDEIFLTHSTAFTNSQLTYFFKLGVNISI